MDIKNSFSNFQMEKSRIVHLTIDNDFVELPQSGLEHQLSIGNPYHKIFKKDDVLFCVLHLQVNHVSVEHETENKIGISLVVEGLFSFTGGDEDVFRKMLVLNGNTALYSIARAHIISLSSNSLISGQIVLPMVNFIKVAEELEKNGIITK